ncbi:MAG: hypothetical protein Q8K78_08615, partial [Planctomycetaceae bacterium]|nr:hypothetical protein [Planctomycetaceae bacterium]
CLDAAGQATKAILALNCYQTLLRIFALDGQITWNPDVETFEDAVLRIAARLTDDDLRAYAAATIPPDSHIAPFEADFTPFITLLSRSRR